MTKALLSGSEPITSAAPIGVRLLSSVVQRIDLSRMEAVLSDLLLEFRMPVLRVEAPGAARLRLITGRAEVLLSFRDAPLPRDQLADPARPEGGEDRDALARIRLKRHRAVLSLSLRRLDPEEASDSAPLSHYQGLAVIQRLIRSLSGLWPADLVIWEPSRTVYTISEFNALERRERIVPTRPRRCELPHRDSRRQRPKMLDIGQESPALTEVFSQLDKVLPRHPEPANDGSGPGPQPQPAPLARTPAEPTPQVANDLPDLPRPGHDVQTRLKAVFGAIQLPRDNALCTAKDATLPGRLAVYALNGSILVMAFPVGMGMLTYNVMKGENLTATARMMALTGIGMALSTYGGLGTLLPFA
ncbi:hypothetical protein [Frigidibacter sp. ROC022]|uniref:hypothetical protein n=1 Tax=Frigidibacter sp. ROC022 TaxID=2971796 RepID=UPI00215A1202|nr:hypothetical protein [Frigidibacter sp. ROC022]MCR8725690.1 hypothetical protein [Frigidibacter sp. ROC022]